MTATNYVYYQSSPSIFTLFSLRVYGYSLCSVVQKVQKPKNEVLMDSYEIMCANPYDLK
jgi:hypothetical protein